MPASNFWSIVFFLMLVCIGMGSQFNHLMAITTVLYDHSSVLNRHKQLTSLGVTVFCFAIGLSMCTQGGLYVFRIFENYGASAMVCFGNGIWQCIAIGWCYGADDFLRDISKMTNEKCNRFFGICWKFITPVLLMGLLIRV